MSNLTDYQDLYLDDEQIATAYANGASVREAIETMTERLAELLKKSGFELAVNQDNFEIFFDWNVRGEMQEVSVRIDWLDLDLCKIHELARRNYRHGILEMLIPDSSENY